MTLQNERTVDAEITLDARNRRVRLGECGRDPLEAAAAAERMAKENGCDKIWGFVSPADWRRLERIGFQREGTLPGYFEDAPAVAVGRYLSDERAHSARVEKEDAIILRAMERAGTARPVVPHGYSVRMATRDDAPTISCVLTSVFATYPTPIGSGEAILRAMDRDVHFAVVQHEDSIAGVASADVDRKHRVAEMTDCAVLPEYRGQRLMTVLLDGLAEEVRALGLRSLFTLARATSGPMNVTFARLGYDYTGRLLNNCHIAGGWEDMNLWVKPLAATAGARRWPVRED